MAIIKKIVDDKFLRVFLIVYVCMQPFLDIFWLNDGSIEVWGFTIPTILRFGFGCVLLVLSLMSNEASKQMLAYMGCAIGYAVLHHLHCVSFESLVPGNFNYSIINELFYIARMVLPIGMIYLARQKLFDKETFKIVAVTLSATITVMVVVTNLLEISLASYTNEIIAGNVFDWFQSEMYGYRTLASKGYFYSSITTTLLLLFLPYNIHLSLYQKKYLWLVFFQALACFMVGTKAMTLGALIIIILSTCLYLFFSVLKKDLCFNLKNLLSLIMVAVCFVSLYPYSPSYSRTNFDASFSAARDEEAAEKSKDTEDGDLEGIEMQEYSYDDKESMVGYLEQVHPYVSITQRYIATSYSYEYDPEFWCRFLENTAPSQRMQNRLVQQAIFDRVKEINDNELDNWLGIGYSRTSNIFNLERDFLYQYYSIGIIGTLLFLGPYIFVLLAFMLNMLMNFKEEFTFANCMLCMGIGLTLFSAYYSGNTMESLGITIPLGVFVGAMLKDIKSLKSGVK